MVFCLTLSYASHVHIRASVGVQLYSMEPSAGRWFPEHINALLELFYGRGLTGWVKSMLLHSQMLSKLLHEVIHR